MATLEEAHRWRAEALHQVFQPVPEKLEVRWGGVDESDARPLVELVVSVYPPYNMNVPPGLRRLESQLVGFGVQPALAATVSALSDALMS